MRSYESTWLDGRRRGESRRHVLPRTPLLAWLIATSARIQVIRCMGAPLVAACLTKDHSHVREGVRPTSLTPTVRQRAASNRSACIAGGRQAIASRILQRWISAQEPPSVCVRCALRLVRSIDAIQHGDRPLDHGPDSQRHVGAAEVSELLRNGARRIHGHACGSVEVRGPGVAAQMQRRCPIIGLAP